MINKVHTVKTSVKDKKSERGNNCLFALLKGQGIAMAFTCIVFALCAVLVTYTDTGMEYIGVISTLCTAVSALIAGYCVSRAYGRRGLAVGMGAGLLYGLIIVLIGLFAGGMLSVGTLSCITAAVAGGGIGGILGVNFR